MSETRIGVRDLKAHLSYYLRRVKAGESLVITSRGRTIGRLIPARPGTEEVDVAARIEAMVAAGLAQWNGEHFQPHEPVAVNQGPGTVSDLVIEDREPIWWAEFFKMEDAT